MKIVDFEMPCEFPSMFCPICGHPICRRGGDVEQAQCEHILFLFGGRLGEFVYASSACKQTTAETMKLFDNDVHLEPVEYALWHIDPLRDRNILCLSITSYGGEDLRTLSVAIDLNPPEDTASPPAAGKARKAKAAKKGPVV